MENNPPKNIAILVLQFLSLKRLPFSVQDSLMSQLLAASALNIESFLKCIILILVSRFIYFNYFFCFFSVSFCWSSFRMQLTKLSLILIGTAIKSYASLNGAYKRICNICYNIFISAIYIIANYWINNCISDIYIQKWYFIKKWYCIKNSLTAEAFRTFKISFLYVCVIQFLLLEFAFGQISWL